MAIAFRAAANDGGTDATISIAKPTGTVDNDVMVACITWVGGTTITVTTVPTGWTLIDHKDSTTVLGQSIYRRVAASEGASYDWVFSAGTPHAGGIVSYSGVDNANPINAYAGQANASSASVTAPTITTTVDNCFLVGCFGAYYAVATFTPPGGMTERVDKNSGANGACECTDESFATAGATGTRVATASGADVNIGHLIALAPTFDASAFSPLWVPDTRPGIRFFLPPQPVAY